MGIFSQSLFYGAFKSGTIIATKNFCGLTNYFILLYLDDAYIFL